MTNDESMKILKLQKAWNAKAALLSRVAFVLAIPDEDNSFVAKQVAETYTAVAMELEAAFPSTEVAP